MSHCFCKAFTPKLESCQSHPLVLRWHPYSYMLIDFCLMMNVCKQGAPQINKNKTRHIKNAIYKIWAKIIHKINLQNLGKNHPQNLDPKRIKKKVCNYFTFFCWKRVEVWRLQLCFNLCTACFGVLAQNCGTFNIAK